MFTIRALTDSASSRCSSAARVSKRTSAPGSRRLPNVRLADRVDVDSLAVDNGTVTGVNVRSSAGETQSHAADLVVDASGRGSQSPAWLEHMGFARPREDAVRVGLGYTTRIYQRDVRSL